MTTIQTESLDQYFRTLATDSLMWADAAPSQFAVQLEGQYDLCFGRCTGDLPAFLATDAVVLPHWV